MAKILDQFKTFDGYDVRCQLADGLQQTFHFAKLPEDVQKTVDALEANMPKPLVKQMFEVEVVLSNGLRQTVPMEIPVADLASKAGALTVDKVTVTAQETKEGGVTPGPVSPTDKVVK